MTGLDPGTVWSGLLSVVVAAALFVGNGYRITIRDLRQELNDLKVKLPEEYVSKRGLHDMIDPIRDDIRDIKEMLIKGIRPPSE